MKDQKGYGFFDKEKLKNSLKTRPKSWGLLVLYFLNKAKDHVTTHRYTYTLLVISLLVLLYRRNPDLFKRAIKYASNLI